MDFSNFGIEDFLSDETFQKYCLGNDVESVDFWRHWLAEHPEKRPDTEAAKKLYFELNGNITELHFAEDFDFFKKTFFNHVRTSAPPAKKQVPLRNKSAVTRVLLYSSGIAACIAIGLFLFISHKLPDIYTSPEGQKRTIILSDGTQVMLNGGSTLNVGKGYNKTDRHIELKGEAFFQVAHNKHMPFILHTSKFDVRVLGTIFNVKAYPNDNTSEATLLKGSISLTINDAVKSTVLLKPHKKLVIENRPSTDTKPLKKEETTANSMSAKSYAVIDADANTVKHSVIDTAWTHNRLIFEGQSLNNISLVLQRWYGIKIRIQNPDYYNFRYTATFQNDDIINVLHTLQLTNHFNYRKEANEIIIY